MNNWSTLFLRPVGYGATLLLAGWLGGATWGHTAQAVAGYLSGSAALLAAAALLWRLHAGDARLRAEAAGHLSAAQANAHAALQLREIVAMLPAPLFIKDGQHRIVMMNAACEDLFGVPFAALEGNTGSGHFPAEQMEGFLVHDRAAFAGGRLLVNEEFVWCASRAENRQMQTFKNPVFGTDGQPQLLIGMCFDITDRKRTEAALQRTLDQLRAMTLHHDRIREDEQRRIALNIHDELGQNLLAMRLDVARLHARTAAHHATLHRQSGQVLATLDATIKSVREVINELHPNTLELGLCAAVEWLLGQLAQRSGLRYKLQVLDDHANALLPRDQTSGLFRLVQAALTSIACFARAGAVTVSLNLKAEAMTIVLQADSAGIVQAEQATLDAFGIRAIRERVAAMGGEMVLARRQGGSMMTLLLPGVAARQHGAPQPSPA
ncbi:PAS domain-containing protein [Duganella sp. LX20W]|uniref:PAS domain-containing protein n=1 Tax=Rugamonas brunnea TaxID=2758569 RepID=A0A7W2IAA5_9BURK|nr:PAS domain-containing protein [Rugamonas brunnea]MBA5635953.1 PAS domain-containing protein [Rugamonas brunnea]